MEQPFEILWNGYTVCPPDWGMDNVCEVFHRIYYVYGGTAYYADRSGTLPLRPGHLYVLPVLHPYSMAHDPASPLDVLWFHVETPLQLCAAPLELPMTPGSLPHHLLESLRLLSDDLEQLPLLRQLFAVFFTVLTQLSGTVPYPGRDFQKVLEYIDRHPDQELRVEQLARYAGMDRSYFSRKFKSVFQITPNQYILRRKMKAAAQVLTAGASIADAAAAGGYNDEKSFSRAFKKYMEVSPAHYRDSRRPQP